MEKILDRFLRYVAVDTQSNEDSESQPSTAKQLNLLRMLCAELNAMGVEATLDEFGYVMGSIPSNVEAEVPAIGFIAHASSRRSWRTMTAGRSPSRACPDWP